MDGMIGYNEIQKIVKETIKEMGYVKMLSATVVSYSAPNAVINFVGSTVNTTVINKSGVVLSAGNKVWVVLLNEDFGNAFILIKD